MKIDKYWALLVGLLMGLIIGELLIETVMAAEPVLQQPYGQIIMEGEFFPNNNEIEEAEQFLSGNMIVVPKDIEELTIKYGKEYGICPELIQAVIFTESAFKPEVSNGKCKGLMQISTSSHRKRMNELNVTDIYDTEQNIETGCHYLKELFDTYGDTAKCLMLYNGDPNATKEGYISGYARKVMKISRYLEWRNFR